MDLPSIGTNYLQGDIMYSQLQRNCHSAAKGVLPDSEAAIELALQSNQLAARRQRWPQKIIAVWRNRTVPVFSAEAITKLNQSHSAEVERVNDHRKRHKDSIRADISRKKKLIDDLQTKRSQTYDNTELTLNQLRLELAIHGYNTPPSWEKNQIKAKIQATLASCSSTFARFRQTEQAHMDQLADLERNFLPIQLLSTQSNQKNLTIRKQNCLVGWIPHQDKYVLIQNTTCPAESEIMRHISHEPETTLTNLPLSIHGLLLLRAPPCTCVFKQLLHLNIMLSRMNYILNII